MIWQIPLFEPDLDEQEVEALAAVIRSKWLTMGDRTTEFEQRFAKFCAADHAIAISNCTAALHVALVALGIGPDDEVVVPSLTFVATANAVRYCGASPVFADVASYDEWNVCPATIEPHINERTKAVIAMHYAGYPCDMEGIVALAGSRGLAVVEDVAHAPGAAIGDKAMGTWGDIGCFSFFSNKNMTTGEGGMITTNLSPLADRMRKLRSHGMTTLTLDRHKGHAFSYDVVDLGYNYRMSELNAALGLCQLNRLSEANRRRASLVNAYHKCLAGIRGIDVPFRYPRGTSAFHIMPILLPKEVDRSRIMGAMKAAGIQTSVHYRPVDTFTAYQEAALGPSPSTPLATDIGMRTITLPLFPSMTEHQVQTVCTTLEAALIASH